LKKVLKEGSENPGVDETYLIAQSENFTAYQDQREIEGFPRPLGIGVMMWDEVKVRRYHTI